MLNGKSGLIWTSALLVLCALSLENLTLATNDTSRYFIVRRIATAAALAAIALLAISARRVAILGIAASAVLFGASIWVIVDALARGMW